MKMQWQGASLVSSKLGKIWHYRAPWHLVWLFALSDHSGSPLAPQGRGLQWLWRQTVQSMLVSYSIMLILSSSMPAHHPSRTRSGLHRRPGPSKLQCRTLGLQKQSAAQLWLPHLSVLWQKSQLVSSSYRIAPFAVPLWICSHARTIHHG